MSFVNIIVGGGWLHFSTIYICGVGINRILTLFGLLLLFFDCHIKYEMKIHIRFEL